MIDAGSKPARAEAAAWIARLQNAEEGDEIERAFQRWLSADSDHRRAFEAANRVWEELAGASAVRQDRKRLRRRQATASIILAVCAIGTTSFWYLDPLVTTVEYATRRGEQRHLVLDDKSVVTLNTDSRIKVRYSRRQRHIELVDGEALFDVAHGEARPFVVGANGDDVRATGTSFEVRRNRGNVSVTLLQGTVAIERPSLFRRSSLASLTPGERWNQSENTVKHLSAGDLAADTAWLQQKIVLSDTPLGQAVTEMNRYNDVQISVSEASVAALPITGVFAVNASTSFATAIAKVYRLEIVRSGTSIQLVSRARVVSR